MADLSDERAFYYVDGIPTKGMWIDLELVDDTDEVLEELAEAGIVPRDEDGDPDYGGDLLVADVDGCVAEHFLGKYGTFDLDEYVELRDWATRRGNRYSAEAIAAYLDWAGSWSQSDFEDKYYGEAESKRAFAEEYAEETMEIPKHLEGYIDCDALARDLFINSFYFTDGHVFRSY